MRYRLACHIVTLLIAALLLPALMAGCEKEKGQGTGAGGSGGTPGGTASTGGAKVKIGFLVKQPDEPWFQTEWTFAQKAADANGFELLKIGTPDGEKALSAIDNLAANGAKGFV